MSESSGVSVQAAAPRGIAAVRARVPAGRVGAVFKQYLDQVYATARQQGIALDGQNIFVYRDAGPGEIDVEFGVGVSAPFEAVGGIAYSELPRGEAAVATLLGDYARLGTMHDAIIEWCKAHGRKRAGPRWEVYGHFDPNAAQQRTDVYYLLERAS